ncbi:MAG TPA: hypothetical protein VFD43_00255 [Planctomycetota bacterium]|nr:hypothetical protein [Planctomycetota bacterium]
MGKKTKDLPKLTAQEAAPRRRRLRVWKPGFLAALEKSRSVTHACEAVRMSRTGAYDARDGDPEFAAAWDRLVNARVDVLTDSMFERATVGARQVVYDRGRRRTVRRPPSDLLAIFLAKSLRPEQFNLAPGDSAGAGSSARELATEIGQALRAMDGSVDESPESSAGEQERQPGGAAPGGEIA